MHAGDGDARIGEGQMGVLRRVRMYCLLSALVSAIYPAHALAQANSGDTKPQKNGRGTRRAA